MACAINAWNALLTCGTGPYNDKLYIFDVRSPREDRTLEIPALVIWLELQFKGRKGVRGGHDQLVAPPWPTRCSSMANWLLLPAHCVSRPHPRMCMLIMSHVCNSVQIPSMNRPICETGKPEGWGYNAQSCWVDYKALRSPAGLS